MSKKEDPREGGREESVLLADSRPEPLIRNGLEASILASFLYLWLRDPDPRAFDEAVSRLMAAANLLTRGTK